MALRRNNLNTAFYFKDDVQSLQRYFSQENHSSKVRAFPGEGLDIPIWILGSSTDSAFLAAELGLPYAFAAHFAPNMLKAAAEIYRMNFKPSEQLQEPYFMVCVNIITADTNEEALFLSSSLQNLFAGIVTNRRMPLSPPTEKTIFHGIPEIEQAVQSMTSSTYTGSPEQLAKSLIELIDEVHAQEIMNTKYIYDDEKRLKSFELIKETFDLINQQ